MGNTGGLLRGNYIVQLSHHLQRKKKFTTLFNLDPKSLIQFTNERWRWRRPKHLRFLYKQSKEERRNLNPTKTNSIQIQKANYSSQSERWRRRRPKHLRLLYKQSKNTAAKPKSHEDKFNSVSKKLTIVQDDDEGDPNGYASFKNKSKRQRRNLNHTNTNSKNKLGFQKSIRRANRWRRRRNTSGGSSFQTALPHFLL